MVTGAHGLMIEVHPEPEKALCDGAQSFNGKDFGELMGESFGLPGCLKLNFGTIFRRSTHRGFR